MIRARWAAWRAGREARVEREREARRRWAERLARERGAEIEAVVAAWRAEVSGLDPRLRDLVITVTAGDMLHVEFELGEEWFDAHAEGGLDSYAFADGTGHFEDSVLREDVPAHVVGLFAAVLP
ncbi:hypothetical protein [Actinosynnema pretiosum]|uniref:Uncharacterized protein n=1 Tax=Actinosynnema pretiosum TaxID=42197 RepID=A0A290Z9A1_9PSEU|nr:hypothetical protein [Actinosynnema pretiosum]ATE55553.1 hypothetical protein CNX65_21550 [Actinosynnema pretiosum]